MSTPLRQLALDLPHRTALGRDDFFVTPGNQDAVAWIDLWPDWPAPALVIHGPPACGKTHLAALWAEKNGAPRLTANAFLETPVDILMAGNRHIVIDSIDPLIGDRQKETHLFHLYNMAREEQGSLLLTMALAPVRAPFALPDLASRLRAAPAATVQAPDDLLLSAVLGKLFADRQIQIGPEILAYILPRMERSLEAARALVDAADRLALSEKKPVSVALLRPLLAAD